MTDQSQMANLQQENNRLRQENAMLRWELFPPESPKKELKYWIVTWLWSNQTPYAAAINNWPDVLKEHDYGKRHLATNISILEQRVLIDQ